MDIWKNTELPKIIMYSRIENRNNYICDLDAEILK